jgi:hypothetical protein
VIIPCLCTLYLERGRPLRNVPIPALRQRVEGFVVLSSDEVVPFEKFCLGE